METVTPGTLMASLAHRGSANPTLVALRIALDNVSDTLYRTLLIGGLQQASVHHKCVLTIAPSSYIRTQVILHRS